MNPTDQTPPTDPAAAARPKIVEVGESLALAHRQLTEFLAGCDLTLRCPRRAFVAADAVRLLSAARHAVAALQAGARPRITNGDYIPLA